MNRCTGEDNIITETPAVATRFDREALIETLRAWAAELVSDRWFQRAYLFGSLLNREGQQFVPADSDIDILLQFSSSLATPSERVEASESALERKRKLEQSLVRLLGARRRTKPIVSILAATGFETENGIHKGRDPTFFPRTKFLDLTDQSPGRQTVSLGTRAAVTFWTTFRGAVQAIQHAQRCRNEFFAVASTGKQSFLPWDHQRDPLPKEMCRAAAQLRYFAERLRDDTDQDVNWGLSYIDSLVKKYAAEGRVYAKLFEWLAVRRGRGIRSPLGRRQHLLLWEILATKASREIMSRQSWSSRWVRGVRPDAEVEFLHLASKPSLRLGDVDLQCKLMPESLWSEANRKNHIFVDEPEARKQILLGSVKRQLPNNTLSTLLEEIDERLNVLQARKSKAAKDERQLLGDIRKRLRTQGSNAYPRVVSPPYITRQGTGENSRAYLRVTIGPSRYGLALIEERRLQLPTAIGLRADNVLNSLAVRVALTYVKDGKRWVEFHQRRGSRNATYKESWDVSAAGYIDPVRHVDPEEPAATSPWRACALELEEELGIPGSELPYRDHYYFFGLGRNDQTGQLDLLACCDAGQKFCLHPGRPLTARVRAFGRCVLTPGSVADFLASKRRWVPTALLTLILTLEVFGFSRDGIRDAFSRLSGRLNLNP